MAFKIPLQPKLFYDSMILWFYANVKRDYQFSHYSRLEVLDSVYFPLFPAPSKLLGRFRFPRNTSVGPETKLH